MTLEFRNIDSARDLNDLELSVNAIWLGAISFEPRCVGGLGELARRGLRLARGIFMKYPAGKSASADYKDMVKHGQDRLVEMGASIFSSNTEVIDVAPYSTSALEIAFANLIEKYRPSTVVVDITCFTKLHTIALANFVSGHSGAIRWVFQYTKPDNYGKLDDVGINKWSDVLIAPMSPGAVLGNEEATRGVILTGFEAHRTMVALGEVEPTGGTVLIGKMVGRPDQARLSASRHKNLVDRLSLQQQNWSVSYTDIFDFGGIRKKIDSEILLAKSLSAPIFVYPFGPKPLVFSTCYYIVSQYAKSAWFAYTTPGHFDLEYSEGIGTTDWFCLSDEARPSEPMRLHP